MVRTGIMRTVVFIAMVLLKKINYSSKSSCNLCIFISEGICRKCEVNNHQEGYIGDATMLNLCCFYANLEKESV